MSDILCPIHHKMPRNAKESTFYRRKTPVKIGQKVNRRVGFTCPELYSKNSNNRSVCYVVENCPL